MSDPFPSYSREQSPLPELPSEIRFEPLGCSAEVIDQANATEQRTGDRAFEPTEMAINRIRDVAFMSDDLLESWSRHPDDRVPIALLTSKRILPNSSAATLVLRQILPRAIQEAEDRGEIWTPLLDALSSSIWSLAAVWSPYDERLTEQHYQKTVVEPWIKQKANPAILRHLILRTKSAKFVRYIASTTTVADVALLDAVSEVCPTAVVDLARNVQLPREFHELMVDRLANLATQAELDQKLVPYIAPAYHWLTRNGTHFRPDHVERLIASLEQHVRRRADDSLRSMCRRIHNLLEGYAFAMGDENVAARVIEMAADMRAPDLALRLLTALNEPTSRLRLTPRIARAALTRCGPSAQVLTTVSESSEARQDPDVRRRLLRARSTKVLLTLAQDGHPEEFPLLFKKLLSLSHRAALNLLKQNREIARRSLSRADLLPLLQTSSQEIRLGAIVFLSDLRDEPEIVEPETHRRSL